MSLVERVKAPKKWKTSHLWLRESISKYSGGGLLANIVGTMTEGYTISGC